MNTVLLIIIIATVLTSWKGFEDNQFFNEYKFQVNRILEGDKLRMITSGFLHADWIHLGLNMWALYLFGGVVSNNFSNTYFLLIYFGSLLTGSMYSLYRNKDDYYYSAIGASGAVSGIVFSAIMLKPEMTLYMLPIPIPLPGYVFAVGYLLYSIYGMKNKLGNIGHSAHLGGAMGGYVITLLIQPSVVMNNTPMIITIGLIILGLLLFGNKLESNRF
ncbi:rhomboid family intramembrane serine protease [Tenacibaculum sp. M341]|uniref:rhomboid family intramembrane serine protease n=1 Tax=Tenacibaculum sp. M341 TaxID=2530339 RepID=UPI00104F65F9|nr:rhomboid family intramembrane serine protease [Tenacibaculum sp. M341]TCI92720.1 rhomboid family intramembrane serine protease [Tenacibaculum sp. M341]